MKGHKFILTGLILLVIGLTACGPATEPTATLSGAEMAFTQVQLTVQAALTETPVITEPVEPLPTTGEQPDEPTLPADLHSPTPTEEGPQGTPTPPEPTEDPSAPCLQAGFVEDRTIPDGTQLLPGEVFIKTWRLINLGSCPWTPDFRVVFANGNAMGAEASLPFTAIDIPIGAVVDVSIEMTAPATPGGYQGFWQLRSGNGEIFGTVPNNNSFYVDIEVVQPTNTPTETLVPTETPIPTQTETQAPTPTDE